MPCLLALKSNPFNSKRSPFVLFIKVKPCIHFLNQLNRSIQLMWISGHIGIHSNEVKDKPAKSTANTILPSFAQLHWTDFTPNLHRRIFNLWSNY
ncbi:RNase H domain-containing protein [Aphis craccivora]|uniref:RNase H domain-containing protein n=1 Tax=Aphis craccivora TaxID=307492 RepID=A0A6G0ZMC1_APHCR|nr:RNase H domain-containing protein [Aphis craccivora]